DNELQHNISTIEDLFKKLGTRESTLRTPLDSLFLHANVSSEGQNNNSSSNRKENPKFNKSKKNGKGKRR
ncbi:hypothetical protein MKW92_003167, partial [Papaver armeniacum]